MNLKVLYQSRIELTWRLADYCNDNIETRLRLQTEGTDWQTVLGAEGCLRLLATLLHLLDLLHYSVLGAEGCLRLLATDPNECHSMNL